MLRRLLRRPRRPPPGEYPPSFTHAWIRRTLPTAAPHEARALLATMHDRGWTEAEVAERILPYMPRRGQSPDESSAGGRPAVSVPARVSVEWLDRRLPAMDRRDIGLVVEELERRGWPATDVAAAVLPHLLGKLPPVDATAVLDGLGELGMSAEEIARLRTACA